MYYPTQNSTVQPTLIGSSLSSPMAPPSDFRRCSIRNCPHFVAEQSSNKMCEVCRGRHRIYASAKRARRKANDAGRPATAEDLVGLNSVSDLQSEIQLPQPTGAASPALHSVPITSSAHRHPQPLQLSNWTGIDPHLFATLSPAVTLPHSSSELSNALVMAVSTKKPSTDEPDQIQAAPAAQQGSANDQVVLAENTNRNQNQYLDQDHPQDAEGHESMRVCSVRGCRQMMPDSSEYKMCQACRVRYQKYGTAKRARWKANKEKAGLEVAATATANGNSDPESTPKYSGDKTGENLKEGDKDENSPPAPTSPNFRVSADASEEIGNSRSGVVDDVNPARNGSRGEKGLEDQHQVRAEDKESEARRQVDSVRGAAQAVADLQISMDSASSTAQQPPHHQSALADTIVLDTTIVTTQAHLNPLTLSVPQLQPYPTIPMHNPPASQPSLSSSTSTSAAAATSAKHDSLSYDQAQAPRSLSTVVQSHPSSGSMANGFSKFRVELLEAAKAALANQSQNRGHAESGNASGVGMVMTASDMSLRARSRQVFGTGSGSGACAERVVGFAASAGSGKDLLGTNTTALDNNVTAEVGDAVSTTCLLSAPGAVGGTDATSVQNVFRMDESTDKDVAVVDQGVQGTKDRAAGQGQSTVPSLTSMPKGKRKARSKAKDGAGQAPTAVVGPPVASTLTSGSLPPPVPPPPPNSHPYYHHPYPPPYPYPYYSFYYPPYPGAHPYPYPYPRPRPAPHAPQSINKPSRKKKKKNGTGDKDNDAKSASVEMNGQGHGYGYGYGVGQPLPYGYPHPHPPLPPGTSLTQTKGTGVWAYPAPYPGFVGISTGGSNSNTNSSPPPSVPGPSYATPYANARLPLPLPPPPQTRPPAASPPQTSCQYGPYQYTCGPQPYNGTPLPLGTPVMPVSYYSVSSGGSNVSGTSTTGTRGKDKGKQTEGASGDGKGRRTWTASDGGVEGVERKGRKEKIANEPLNPSQQEPKQVQMQFSYYHYGPNGEVVETFSEGARKKRRKVDPNYLEKLEVYRAPVNREKTVPVPGFGSASSLKERQCAEEAPNSISISSSSTVHPNGPEDPDFAISPEFPVGDGIGEVGLVKQKEKQSVSMSVTRTQPCSNKNCARRIAIENDHDDSLCGRVDNESAALCGRCKARFKKMRKRAKKRFRLVPRRTVLDRVLRDSSILVQD